MLFLIAACFGSAFLVSIVATRLMKSLSPKWGLIDQPAARKVHLTPTPLGGGVGIWLGVMLPMAVAHMAVWYLSTLDELPQWLPVEFQPHLSGMLERSGLLWLILGAGTILSTMGLIDDRRNLPWQPRLVIQIVVAVALVACGVRATVFAPWPWLGFILSVGWILVLVNSFNFLDNMDGLSSGIALIAALIFSTIMLTSLSEPRWFVAGVLLVLAGSLTGFLWWNWSPASIFMGDTGSYFIGLLIASMTIVGTFYEDSPESGRHVILAPLCVLAIPLYDFTSVMIIRLKQGRSPFQPDKSHFSHRLVELGLKPRNAVLTVHLATLTTGLGALLLYEVTTWNAASVVVGLVACVLFIVAILETAGRPKT
jgi:UDP-GlcNAc:undecaprenyl-phosphate/decaprenyl-phosphate GlcNAc-1-phosphate transferase